MQPLYPVTEENCKPHYGKPVLLFTRDGTEVHGILSRIVGQKLYLNEEAAASAPEKVVASKKKVRLKSSVRKAGKAKKRSGTPAVSADVDPFFGPNPFEYQAAGTALSFNLSDIGALFVLG
jgi:hypothetical protein